MDIYVGKSSVPILPWLVRAKLKMSMMTPGAGQASRSAPLASEQAVDHAFAVTHTNSDIFAACTNLLLIAKGAARVSFSPVGRDAHHRDALLYVT